MGTIYDIAQQRAMIRCKTNNNIVLTPTLVNLGILSALDSVTNYFASTNHIMNHNAEMIIRVKAADPTTAFPVGAISFIAGFVFPAKQCQAPDGGTGGGSDQYYAMNGIFRSALNTFRVRGRRHGTNDTHNMDGINDADFIAPGVEIWLEVTNRWTRIRFRKAGTVTWLPSSSFALVPDKPAGPNAYPQCDTEGKGTPAGGRFRWAGSDPRSGGTNLPVRETLIPMFTIQSACTLEILAVNQGDEFQLAPVQP